MTTPSEIKADLSCGVLFWGAIALVVLTLTILFWRAFIRWAVQ